MGITNLSPGSFTELVFENRHQQYGAYALRKQYSDRLLIAFIGGISIIVLLAVSPLIANVLRSDTDIVFEDYLPTQVLVEPPVVTPPKSEIQSEPPAPKPPAPKGSVLAGKPVDTPVDSLEADPFDPSLPPGDPKGDPDILKPIDLPVNHGTGTFTVKKNDEPLRVADESPSFNGDYRKWLSANLSYPEFAKEMGTQGIVHIEFVVDEEGNISNAKVLNDIGDGCGEAALKAVRSMPKWKPGKKDGKNVKVYFTLPIKFTLR